MIIPVKSSCIFAANLIEGKNPLFFLRQNLKISKDVIEELVNGFIDDSKHFLVDVHIGPGNAIVVELDGERGIAIDDCVAVSRHIESSLDRDQEDFSLTVSSAGMGQPLKKLRQYHKNKGRNVKVISVDNNEFNGVMSQVDDSGIELILPPSKKKKLPERNEKLAWDEIKETKVKVVFK